MKYYDEEAMHTLRAVLEEAVLSWPKVTVKKMFGCPCYTVGKVLFAFLVTRGVVLTRLAVEEREQLLGKAGATAFHAGKKTARNWVTVPVKDRRELMRILPSVRKSYESVMRATATVQDN
jgi:TfoX/Sxy family transcriptional regulator of competence genes